MGKDYFPVVTMQYEAWRPVLRQKPYSQWLVVDGVMTRLPIKGKA